MKIERHIFDTYLAVVRGSIGSNMFRHTYASFDGEQRDTMEDGWKSCAFHVSAILKMFGAIDKTHSTVASTVEALKAANWQAVDIDKPQPGDVLVWDKLVLEPGDEPVDHIGFYVGDNKAISNSWRARTPIEHDWLCRDHVERPVVAIYRGQHLMPDDIKHID